MRSIWVRAVLLVVLGVAPVAAIVRAQSGPSEPAAIEPPGTTELATPASADMQEPLYASPTRRDRIGRILAPVWINGQGPFRFVVDTGATHSAIAEHLTHRAGLDLAAESAVMLHGATGSAIVATVRVERFQAGELVLNNLRMPVISAVLPGADGVLGIEGLEDKKIAVDFSHNKIQILRSRGSSARNGFLKIRVTLGFNRLLLADAHVGRVRVKAIIDTGAERTIGNVALREALKIKVNSRNESIPVDMTGVTADIQSGHLINVPRISLGGLDIRQVKVAFGDVHVFNVWGLAREPALLIGMDVLGLLDAVIIDYQRREVQFKPQSAALRNQILREQAGHAAPDTGR